mmetsp:Transcript_1231/g.2494  ORF Transcript_1231/g.2494 Transcript_1231/m.2494 type:complete len:208 (-) Transcript_1231:500-1123(-)
MIEVKNRDGIGPTPMFSVIADCRTPRKSNSSPTPAASPKPTLVMKASGKSFRSLPRKERTLVCVASVTFLKDAMIEFSSSSAGPYLSYAHSTTSKKPAIVRSGTVFSTPVATASKSVRSKAVPKAPVDGVFRIIDAATAITASDACAPTSMTAVLGSNSMGSEGFADKMDVLLDDHMAVFSERDDLCFDIPTGPYESRRKSGSLTSF